MTLPTSPTTARASTAKTGLGTPLGLRSGAVLANRLLKSAMTEGLADEDDRPTAAHVALYGAWSRGGAGVLVTGNVMVDRRYLERPGNVVVEDDRAMDALRAWAQAGTQAKNHLWMQVSHPGRQCSRFVAKQPVAPSAVRLHLGGLFGTPRALEEHEIVDIVARYARTARIAKEAGFTGVQVHGAHGYLCSQFLSPRTNVRSDRWGGTLENRARFLRAVVRAVRVEVGDDYPVSVKLNSSDFQKGAFSPEDSCQVAAWLVDDGVDLLEISGGTYERLRLLGVGQEEDSAAKGTRDREAYFLDYAQAIRKVARVPLAVTGGFRSREAMVAALAGDQLDVIGLARPLCTEPDLPRRLIEGSAVSARADERALQVGPGPLGPRSGSASVRGLNAQAQTAWFYKQIVHLSRGEPLEPSLSAASALFQHVGRERRLQRARRAREGAPGR